MWLAYVVAAIFIILAFLHIAWKLRISKFAYMKGPPTIPWFGSVFYLEREPYKFFRQFQQMHELYDSTFLVWLAYKPIIISGSVKFAEVILSSQENLAKSVFYWNLHEWLGTGLLTSAGSKWKKRRRAITPTFHFAILNDFVEIFIEHSNILVEQFKKVADTGKAVDVQPAVSLAALDTICETSMGVRVNAQTCADSTYVTAVSSMNGELQARQRYPWLWPKWIYSMTSSGRNFYKHLNILHSFTTKVINDRIKSRQESKGSNDNQPKRKQVFLDMLLDLYDKGEIDVEGIREEVDTFMFEGHDTTASGLSWILHLLGKHPKIQQKLHDEIDAVSSKSGSLVEKISEMKYLKYVIKESLRLHPPVSLFGRTLEKDTLIDGHIIPKGTDIGIDAKRLHTNPEYWDEPDQFNPDRFDDQKYAKRNPYSYVPFSAGPRNCVGQKFAMLEEKILLFHVLSSFRLESVQNDDEIEGCFEIIHRSNNGLHVKFYSRHGTN